MSHQPSIDDRMLRDLLLCHYGIDVRSFTYRVAEWSVGGFTITAGDGERFYLKVQEAHPSTFAASAHDFYLPLTLELHQNGTLPHIAYPIPTLDGRLWVASGPYALVLCNFIDGVTVGHSGMTGAVLARLADLVGRLHTSTAHLAVSDPLYESFDITFSETLLSAAKPADDKNVCLCALSQALQPRTAEILGYFDRLNSLQRKLRHQRREMVVCHTDLHGENLMHGCDGNLYIVDWDNAMIAPREHDLFFFAGDERFGRLFLPAYEAVTGPVLMDSDVLRFYYYRRGLEDIADYVVRIQRGDGGSARDRADLVDLLTCLDGLTPVEETVARIAAAGAPR